MFACYCWFYNCKNDNNCVPCWYERVDEPANVYGNYDTGHDKKRSRDIYEGKRLCVYNEVHLDA